MRLGLHASSFDPIHPGYLYAWQQAIEAGACDGIVAAIQEDPSRYRPEKHCPALTVDERFAILRQFRQVEQVLVYHDEANLRTIIQANRPVCLIVGEDHQHDPVTGADLVPVFWAKRKPEWSGTQIARRIAESLPDVAASMRFTEGLDPGLMARWTYQDIRSIHSTFRTIVDAFDQWKESNAKPPRQSVPGQGNPPSDPGVQGPGVPGLR